MQTVDTIGRTLFRHPFFALRETEDMLRQLDGLSPTALIHAVLARNGGTEIIPSGLDHVPDSGKVIIAATHPTGLFDFIAHADVLLKKRPDLKVVANRETERFLGPDMIVPVDIDKENRTKSGLKTQRAMQRHLDDGGALMIFGSGRVPHKKDGHLVEPEWRGGATKLSRVCNAPIVPAALATQNSPFYYRIRSVAQYLSGGNDSFGAMIGSLRYSAELMSKLGGRFEVFYGSPLDAGTAPASIQDAAEGLVPGLYRSRNP